MTLQQEAYKRIDMMSDRGLQFILGIMDQLQTMTTDDFGGSEQGIHQSNSIDIVETIDETALDSMSKSDKKALFLRSCGKMQLDTEAIHELRHRSMI